MLLKKLKFLAIALAIGTASSVAANQTANQTDTLSPISSNEQLPFRISIELADFSLPNGIHSFASAVYEGKWLFLCGRTNGMHDFSNGPNNFPPQFQNTTVYVVDPTSQAVSTRDLTDPSSGLTQHQIDLLSVTSPQFYNVGSTLYITGGYGVDTATGKFSTKDVLTAITIPGLIHWVTDPAPGETAVQYIRQISNPVFQVTGGYMGQLREDEPTLLVFGQNFKGFYTDNSNGAYTEEVRRFNILDDGVSLAFEILPARPRYPDSDYRRRDLNVVPAIHYEDGRYKSKLIAFSGVFTPETGVWTVPVVINAKGKSDMEHPYAAKAFKQGMNNYICPTLGLFSKETKDMFTLFFGGISYGYFENGVFEVDSEIPFINQVTAVNWNQYGSYFQYLMDAEYPVILSTQSNPGNQLLFGAGGQFIEDVNVPVYGNGVVNFDAIIQPIVVGYIIGGIQSTLPNTNVPSDSAASPYIFKVILVPFPG